MTIRKVIVIKQANVKTKDTREIVRRASRNSEDLEILWQGLSYFRLPVTANARQHSGVLPRRLTSGLKNKAKTKTGLKSVQVASELKETQPSSSGVSGPLPKTALSP